MEIKTNQNNKDLTTFKENTKNSYIIEKSSEITFKNDINIKDGNISLNDELNKKMNELIQVFFKIIDEKNKDIDATKKWNEIKNNIIISLFERLDLFSTKKILNDSIKKFEEDILIKLEQILDDKLINNSIIKDYYNSLFNKIKDNIKGINTFNFMTVGPTGSGKSCLINALLNFDKAKEGCRLRPIQEDSIQLSNPNCEPAITIYDTIGFDFINFDRGLEKIINIYNENIDNPKKTIHGILFCINNNRAASRIEEQEIKFIKELRRICGDILIIVFTQSLYENTEQKKKDLVERLGNDKIKIIEVLAKDEKILLSKKEILLPSFGVDDLKKVMKEECKNKLFKWNIRRMVQKMIIKKFEENIDENCLNIPKKINSNELGKTLIEECNNIVKMLVGNLKLDFSDLDEIISKYNSQKELEEIKNKIFEKNKEYLYNELVHAFNSINPKYKNRLGNFNTNEINQMFDEYFVSNIYSSINKFYLEKAFNIIFEKCKKFFEEIIVKNIKEEEIENLVQKNKENLFKKLRI